MKIFAPYLITHIQLNDGWTMPARGDSQKGNYLVFWWKELALGQLFVEPGNILSETEYFEAAINAIRPAIEFYSKDFKTTSHQWKHWILHHRFEEWSGWMNTILNNWTSAEIPERVPVSVIICTRNRAAFLQQCLQMLKGLTCLPEEIVVVDNAPVDDTTQNVAGNFEGVKYIKESRGGLDIARNAGISNATFPIIAFVDDDVLVHPLWVYNVWETFKDPTYAAMTGLVIASKLDTEAQLIFEKHWSFNRGYTDKIYGPVYFKSTLSKGPPVWEIGAGANMAFRKSIFEKAGYFNELLDAGAAGCNGDSEMWFRILLTGHSICYNPRAVVYHEHRDDMKGLKKQIFSYMRGFTVAALTQQQQQPEAGYKKFKLRGFIKYYLRLIIKEFPGYHFQFQTLWVEIKGIISGLLFYKKNKKELNKQFN